MNSSDSEKITIADAARIVGKAPTTIRRLIDLGHLNSVRDETGKHYIERTAVIAHYSAQAHAVATQSTRKQVTGATADTTSTGVNASAEIARLLAIVEGFRAQMTLLQDSLQRERTEKDSLNQRVLELERERSSLMMELRAFLAGDGKGILSRWMRK